MKRKSVESGWNNLKYINNPSEELIKIGISKRGWAIQYADNPSEELQLLAIKKDYDSIKYIENPFESVQIEAINISYDALRYIDNPSFNAEKIAVKNNEAAIKFVVNLDKEKMLKLLRINILIIKYIYRSISEEELNSVLKEVISNEEVEEKYIRDFLSCNIIDKNSSEFKLDKIIFIYKYGSKKAKKIAVDEKLKIR